MQRDRHGRLSAVDREPRRRPADGFRAQSAQRFRELALTAIGTLPADLRTRLMGADIIVADLPPESGPAALVRWQPPVRGDGPKLVLYRRAIEARAESKHDLRGLLGAAIAEALEGPDA